MGRPSTLSLSREGSVATVMFDRPDRRNGVVVEMVEEMYDVTRELADDDSIDLVVLTGAGETFCPGADLAVDRSEAARLPDPQVYHSSRLLHEMPAVTVAVVNGACAGAGMAWAAACDLRLASADAKFSTAFQQIGLASELGLAAHLQRQLGESRARELCFLPRKLTAAELRDIGWISHVIPAQDFAAQARSIVDAMASRGRYALRTLKEEFLTAARSPLAQYIDFESERHLTAFTGEAGRQTRLNLASQGARVSSAPTTTRSVK